MPALSINHSKLSTETARNKVSKILTSSADVGLIEQFTIIAWRKWNDTRRSYAWCLKPIDNGYWRIGSRHSRETKIATAAQQGTRVVQQGRCGNDGSVLKKG
ncbi:hypothetical protein [uncultured Deefgea sp.]|uniref:hypothetical protein n=1 Tax=uncultured Deefgea sp. TaxID=1304914 RepID=UPI00260A25FA|nr:hypothetical protein [uncultured Deefgea sp.]